MDDIWQPIKDAPTDKPIQVGWWDVKERGHDLVWKSEVCRPFRYLPGLFGGYKMMHLSATHFRHVPNDPPDAGAA